MKFNDAYIIVDEKNFLIILRELDDLPKDIEIDALSYGEQQELRPVKNVLLEWQLELNEKGKEALEELKKQVIIEDYGATPQKVGRYYLSQRRLETLAGIIEKFTIS
ncbi:MAG: hypothetical protein AMJ45_00170 [Syntrophobacter sp. DG_60]|nr:MAG: hypothetical protein AMJ45_00170 [Syntrophobacter sp. DG_60]